MRRLILTPLAAAALLACGSGPAPAKEPAAPAKPEAIVRYHDSGDWASDTARAVDRATRYLAAHADATGSRRPALVLDVDDTAVSSYACLHAADFDRSALTACAEDAALTVIPQTLALYDEARDRGVTVFFVTGRREVLRGATRRNLREAGYHGSLRITMRRNGRRRGSNEAYKARSRRAIERRGYRILVNAGDQRSDLSAGPGLRQVKLPNPMYLTR
jgi:predicted secreted acid phosphatase